MSGSNNEITNTDGPASSAEPSMEEILASIRRILKDDPAEADPDGEEDLLVLEPSMRVKPGIEPAQEAEALAEFQQPEPIDARSPPAALGPNYPDDPHFAAEPSIPQLTELEQASPELADLDTGPEVLETPYADNAMPESTKPEAYTPTHPPMEEEQSMSDDGEENVQPPDGLVSDATREAASGSIGALIRSISSDRQIAVGRVGLTLEDLVREELRPLLKSWLDSNLPLLVERIVRAEIQRVIERSSV
jgi:cell pole-organizing protein PopZ